MTQQKQKFEESYWEKHGIPRVTLKEAIWQLDASIRTVQTRGVWCLISESGEGKTQSIHAVFRKHGYRVCDIRTASLTHIGAGIPEPPEEGFFNLAVPSDMPRPGEKAVIFFDEYNQGLPHAIALMFKLLEDRSIYGYKLPDDCLVVLAMNPATARYAVSKIEGNAALNRRVKKLFVYSTFADWKEHAVTEEFHFSDGLAKPCHPAVIRYLTAAPGMLSTKKDRDGGKQYCCPATWQTVSLDLYNMEVLGEPIESERTEARVAATINPVNAAAFLEWIRNNEILISPRTVLSSYTKNSELRQKVLSLREASGGALPQLVEAVATYLMSERLKPALFAPRLALFWNDLPLELSQTFYGHLKAAAQEGSGAVEYLKAVNDALLTEPLWQELNEKLDRGFKAAASQLDPKSGSFDPFKT